MPDLWNEHMRMLTLSGSGMALAVVMGAVMLLIGAASRGGLPLGIFYVVSMLYFLALSAIVTKTGANFKRRIKQYQKDRGVRNVLANGMGPVVFALVVLALGQGTYLVALVVAFISSVAAVTSDKFSSEIGILDGTPTSIVTFKKIKKGMSGGVTGVGLFAGLWGAFLVAMILTVGYLLWFFPVFNAQGSTASVCIGFCQNVVGLNAILATIVVVTISGFIGTLVDSVLGHWEEKGVGNKYTSNFLCSVAAGIIGFVLYAMLI